MITTIFHIIARETWEQARRDGFYSAPSLETQGFIHLSKAEQVVGTANRFYRGSSDLVLLVVNPARLIAELRYEAPAEAPESEARFPHLYGTLNLDAVIRVIDFPPNEEGEWSELPRGTNS